MPTFYFAAWTDSGCLLGCSHQHREVSEAVACISCAGGYVVAVEDGVLRALTAEEEEKFNHSTQVAHASKASVEAIRYESSGYAEMVRVRVGDHWTWTTWMRYDTYEQAAAHARNGNKIVALGSAEWDALHERAEPALTPPRTTRRKGPIHRRQDETLVEFVLRFLPYEFDQQCPPHGKRESLISNEPKQSETGCRPFVNVVLDWMNEWEVKLLETIYSVQVQMCVAVQKRLRKTRRPRAWSHGPKA
jgi:hypothetical protein